ncbi:Uncharacterized protein APZ42_031640 [Daphnia magna]|uniref:Reverse transcriptase domain-containing protein n=1 Tax=Daphnia magna TaxID=35525 RepID=A0A164MPC5_9CRUS|nr:Uncharacterized protein APZ42_031640 [Daphnia magna]
MDPNALNAALAALTANQQQQQQQFVLQQQQIQQQQDLLTALANRILAVPVVGPPAAPVPPPAAIIRATLDTDVKFSGATEEILQDWLQLVNRKALAENWGDAEKRRAAISSLSGKALTWQEEIGVNIPQWDDWINDLRGAFEVQLTEGQWQVLVEGRKQLPGESGCAYALDKVKLCRRRATALTDAELTPYLIRGLYRPEMRSVMMGNPPASINAFLTEVRRLESISEPVTNPSSVSTTTEENAGNQETRDSLFQAVEALTNQVAVLTRTVTRPNSPGTGKPALKQVGFDRRPPGSKNEVQCYNCSGYGHISRDCPLPNPRGSPVIEVDVFRVGLVKAMVDSGAKNSVIRADLIRGRSVFDLRVASRTWRTLDYQILPLVGETSLVVRFGGAVTDLNQVLVMENAIFPMVLGMDWIERSGAVICVKEGVAIVEVTRGQKLKENDKDCGYGKAVDELLVMGALVEEEEVTPGVDPGELQLHVRLKKKKGIAASSVQFVDAVTPKRRDGLWLIRTNKSTRAGKEWVTPECLVESQDGRVLIPVVNLTTNKLMVRGSWCASIVAADQVFLIGEEETTTIGALQPPSESPDCDDMLLIEKDVNIDPDLVGKDREGLLDVIRRHWRCFRSKKGLTQLIEHRIETGAANPVHSSPYRVSETERKVIQEQVQKMRADGIVTSSRSPWSSSVVLVKKKNGEIRFCVDYRRLNSVTVKDVYPLPRIEDVLDRLGGAQFFTSLDLESGFWQVPMAKEHQEKTAFVTPDGLFEFSRLPFGLCGAPPTFQRLMDRVLDGLKWTECLVYMDDILVFGGSLTEHNERLHRVLQAIGNAGLTLNLRRYFPRRELDWQPDEGSSTDNDSLSGNEQQIRTEDDKNANQSEFENDLETSTSDTEFEEDEEIRTRTGPVTTRTGRQSRQPERFVAGVRR